MERPLTPRQLAICSMIADGRQNKEIASAQQKSLVSVKRQIEAIMARTGAPNRAAVAAWYVRRVEVRS
jgi:DNA-binding NarL/FixJ family response regulator